MNDNRVQPRWAAVVLAALATASAGARLAAAETAGGFRAVGDATLAQGTAISPPTPPARTPRQKTIGDKTLVAWVTPANLTQRGGSALTIDDQAGHFDGIVLGELAPGKWMAGSNFFARTQKNQGDYPAETADAQTLLQMAVSYRGCDVTIWRNGKTYARYQIGQPQEFGPESALVLGLRHLQAGDGKCFAGTIEDARLYGGALSGEQLAALRPGEPSEPRPLAWLVFPDGKAIDRMGAFPLVELLGDARVIGARLHLSGKGAYLVAMRDAAGNDASKVHYRPRRGVFADPIPFFWKGEYHVFYLRGGIGPVPWEHIVSRDLVHWQELPRALAVDGAPDGPDGGAMFTGSVVEGLGQFHIFYTGHNGRNPQGTEVVMHATSPDLVRWTKHPAEILAPDGVIYKNTPVRDFRDPYVFWNEPEQCYWMVFFGNDARSGKGVQGLAVSKDLQHWQFQAPLAGAGGQECPDLFAIGDTWYLLGGDHYSVARQPRGPYTAPAVSNLIDRPFVYAAKRTFDGKRHVWTGWLWDRSPRSDTGRSCWGGTQCLPRELYAGPGGQLYCRPVAEVTAAFSKTVFALAGPPLSVRGGVSWAVPDHYLLQCRLRLDPKAEVTLTLRQTAEPGSGYRLVLRPAKQEAEIASAAFSHARRIELDAARPVTIQAFVLGSMIETFVNDQYALSCRAYDSPTGKLGLGVNGGDATVLELKVNVPQ